MQVSQVSRQAVASSRPSVKALAKTSTPCRQRCVAVHASASDVQDAAVLSRRDLLGASVTLATLAQIPAGVALADGPAYETFFGFATPPTSYGGYGGNAAEKPRYSFEFPAGWKSEVPSKVEKGTQGVDGRVVNPRVKGQRAFVITLSRAGEDNKSFRLTDIDSTFAGFAGADYDLQDALSSATDITQSTKEVDGNTFFLYEIDSPETRYLSVISVNQGKVFALFVKSPAKSFKASEAKLRHIVETFTLL